MELEAFFPGVWDKLTDAQRRALESAASPRRLEAGEQLSGAGECVGLLAVRSGRLRAYMISDTGREITLYRLFERDICLFSASCVMRGLQFDVSIEAEQPSEVLVVSPEVYKRVMEESAPLANYTNELMASRFSEVMWLVEQILWKSFDRRLAAFLLEESALESSDELRITHERIAAHLGTAREVVTRMLRYFQSEGLVSLSRGTVRIADRAGPRGPGRMRVESIMKTCYIVAAAELAEERLRPEEGDLVIAADAGLRHLARLGIQPDLALGDFDSLGYVPEAPSVEVCPVRKDDTDTMAALKRAHELGFRRVLIFGGLGGGAL